MVNIHAGFEWSNSTLLLSSSRQQKYMYEKYKVLNVNCFAYYPSQDRNAQRAKHMHFTIKYDSDNSSTK